jgi:hypothetical protein
MVSRAVHCDITSCPHVQYNGEYNGRGKIIRACLSRGFGFGGSGHVRELAHGGGRREQPRIGVVLHREFDVGVPRQRLRRPRVNARR